MYISVLTRGEFMNKLKVIPFLALVAMLSACTVNGTAKMKKYSNQVDYATWKENIEAQNSDDEELDGADMGMTVNLYARNTDKTVLNDKVLDDEEMIGSGTMKGLYDKDNDVGTLTTNVEMKMTGKDSKYDQSMTIKGKGSRVYQKGTVEGEDKTLAVDKAHKTYYVSGDYSESSVSSGVMGMAIMPLMAVAMLPASYEAASEENKANYSFYQDGKVFTVKNVATKESQETATIGSETVPYLSRKTTTTTVAQSYYTKKSGKTVAMNINMETIEEVVTTYLIDYDTKQKDTVRTQVEQMIFNVKLELKNVDLEPVDIADYTLGQGDGSIMVGD